MSRLDRLALPVLVAALAAPAAADSITLAPVRDNTLCQDTSGTLSNGAGSYLFAGRTDEPTNRRGLIAFDLGAIPAGAVVNSVSLTLNMSRTQGGSTPVGLHRVLADWGEGASNAPGQEGGCATAAAGDATWVHRQSGGATWTTPGGDFLPTASASTGVAGSGPYTWSSAGLVTDVQAWVDDPAQNFGWLLRGDESAVQTAKRFDSKEHADPAVRPRLTIDFTPGTTAQPGLYQSVASDPCAIIVPANALGQGPSPYPFTPGPEPLLFYQIDADADCLTSSPALLRLVKAVTGLVAHF